MSKLTAWLDHRMEVVGLYTFKDLARYSGVPVASVRRIYRRGLLTVNRTERRLLAGSLRVSLRKLEQLDDGEIDWIEDSHVYDADIRSRPLPGQEDDPTYWMPKEVKQEDRGTPVIGSIQSTGQAVPDDDWQEDWGRHIPQRFGKGRDIYAMGIGPSGEVVVFRNIPPWEFREGQAAVYSWNGWESQGWFGRLYLQAAKTRIITADGKRHDLDPVNVVRVGRVVGRWPTEPA